MASTTPNPPVLPTVTGRTRFDRKAIDRRRIGVWEMFCLGQDKDKIAKHYNVSEKTIDRDIEWWKERLGYNTSDLKDPQHAAMDVGMTAKKLEKVAEDAYVEYHASTNGAIKVRFLQTVVLALTSRHKVLADAGFLPKIGHEREGAPKVEISFEARFGKEAVEAVFDDPKSRRKVLEAAYSVVKTGLLADRDVIGETLPGHATPLAENGGSPEPGEGLEGEAIDGGPDVGEAS